jgi:hypothetical protein
MGAEHKCPCCGEKCTTWGLDYVAVMSATTELDEHGNTTDIDDAHEQSAYDEELSCLKCGGSIEWDGGWLVDQYADDCDDDEGGGE